MSAKSTSTRGVVRRRVQPAAEQLEAIGLFLASLSGDPGPKRSMFERLVSVVARRELDAIDQAGRTLIKAQIGTITHAAETVITTMANEVIASADRMGHVHALFISFLSPRPDQAGREKVARNVVREAYRAGVQHVTVAQVLRMMDAIHVDPEHGQTTEATVTSSLLRARLADRHQDLANIGRLIETLSGRPIDKTDSPERLARRIVLRLKEMVTAQQPAICTTANPSTITPPEPPPPPAIPLKHGVWVNAAELFLFELTVDGEGSVYVARRSSTWSVDEATTYLSDNKHVGGLMSLTTIRHEDRVHLIDEVAGAFEKMEEEGLVGVW